MSFTAVETTDTMKKRFTLTALCIALIVRVTTISTYDSDVVLEDKVLVLKTKVLAIISVSKQKVLDLSRLLHQ